MDSFALAPFPGLSIPAAMEVVLGETGSNCALPLLSQRGIRGSEIARTLSLLPDLPFELGPRGWRLSARPQRITYQMRALWESDLEDFERVLTPVIDGVSVPRPETTLRVVGPWTLACAVEMPNGHRAVTDFGAARELREHLLAGIQGGFDYVIFCEPAIPALLEGKVPGAHDFEVIAQRTPEQLARFLEPFAELDVQVVVHTPGHHSAAHIARLAQLPKAIIDPIHTVGTAILDEWGFALAQGLEPIFVINPLQEARAAAIKLARWIDQLQLPRELLTTTALTTEHIGQDLTQTARNLAMVQQCTDMLHRDAGDL
ncbi:MAG: hypothetical protein Q3976_01370 [Corynebacterium sp.]|nr:hypothetical protein [Corynebacterium sp.]